MNAALRTAGKVPDQKTIDCAGEQIASFGLCARSGNFVQDPANFQPAEIRRKRQAGFRAISILSAMGSQFGDSRRHPRVLPDDRVVNSFASFLVPDDCGFALVGDSDRGQIARALGVSTEEVKVIAQAAFLRDIGKLAGGPPSSESMSRTNKRGGGTAYCEESFRLLSRIPFLKNAAEVIYRVQEWYDGSGFPGGLRGEQIPLWARIIAIANAFEENAAPGNESKSASISKAREEIRRGSGSQFDPELARSFLDIPENVWIELSSKII